MFLEQSWQCIKSIKRCIAIHRRNIKSWEHAVESAVLKSYIGKQVAKLCVTSVDVEAV